MIFPEKIARWCSPGVAPAPAGASAPGGSFPARSPGVLFGVRVLVGGRAALVEGLGESLCRLFGLELREPFELTVLVRGSCSSSLFSGTFSLIGLPRAVPEGLAFCTVQPAREDDAVARGKDARSDCGGL